MIKFVPLLLMALTCFGARGLTIDDYYWAAEANYPVVNRYHLLEQTRDIDLSDINKAWLPRVDLYAQATVQNVVPSFPAALKQTIDMPGLGKVQYKAGADVTQTIWDGGAASARREIVRRRFEVESWNREVELYAVQQRVQSIFFGILLVDEQIKQTDLTISTLEANLRNIQAMVSNGAAMQADADMLEAQLLEIKQRKAQAVSAEKSYRSMLSVLTGLDDAPLEMPDAQMPEELTSNRFELWAFSSRKALNDAQRRLTDVSLMPKVGFFAQGYYGYPGIDYFKAMTGRNLSFNLLAGVKVTWNVDAFYTKKNALRKLDLANEMIDVERETFLHNSAIQAASQLQEIEGFRNVMADDARIVQLRQNVRRATESQLQNGIVDATALTTKINDEYMAQLAAAYHKIQYVQAIYNLKNTLNR